MKVLILARTNSTRIPNKNYKPFHDDLSLFDIKARQLLEAFAPEQVFVSVEDEAIRPVVEKHGFRFLLRDPILCTPEGERFITQRCVAQLPQDADPEILYVSVTDPFFNEFPRVIETWNRVKARHDSLVVVRRLTEQVLYPDGQPANFDFFGQATQCLKGFFTISMCAICTTREVVARKNHYIGDHPYFFTARQSAVDIDTPEDWTVAQALYAARFGAPPA